jgi:hypothetical protein
MTNSLAAKKSRYLLARLPDREHAIEVTIRPVELPSLGTDGLRHLLDVRRVEYKISRRMEYKRGRLDLRWIGRGELIGLDQIEQRIGVAGRGARGCRCARPGL